MIYRILNVIEVQDYCCEICAKDKRISKIPKGHTEKVNSEDRQDHGQQKETKDKHRTHNTTLKT